MTRPLFITFEGIEGSGKSTQIEKVATWLSARGYDCITTFEPGNTPLGKKLRDIILDPGTSFLSNQTEILLFIADRLEHVEQLVKPTLKKGVVVLCDRYIDSTLAYQVGGRGVSQGFVDQLHLHVDLIPDLTFLLDVPVSVGLTRAQNRSSLDRFEQETILFHDRVHAAYLSIQKNDPDRVKLIDGELEPDRVFDSLVEVLAKVFPKGGGSGT